MKSPSASIGLALLGSRASAEQEDATHRRPVRVIADAHVEALDAIMARSVDRRCFPIANLWWWPPAIAAAVRWRGK